MDLASGIAGLIGLASLAVSSASTLYTFSHKIPRVAGEVEAVMDEIRRLTQTLESIQRVVSDRATQRLSERTCDVTVKLKDEISRCTTDLEAWNTCLAALKMEDGKWAKNAVKKLKLAADGGIFSEMRLKISAHRDHLGLLVELLTVDLEMSTSLDIQTIGSKVDKLATEQANSRQIGVSHLEQIQERVQATATFQSTSLAETLEISKSTTKIHETLHDIRSSQESCHQTSRLQIERLDATLAAIQHSLLNMARKGRPRPRMKRISQRMCNDSSPAKHTRNSNESSMAGIFSELVQQTTDRSAIVENVYNLVDLAVTVRYRCGKPQYEGIAVPDPEFEAADFETKLRMVKYLQDLRLLLWLLCRKQFNEPRLVISDSTHQSKLVPDAQLVSSWTNWMTIDLASDMHTSELEFLNIEPLYLSYLNYVRPWYRGLWKEVIILGLGLHILLLSLTPCKAKSAKKWIKQFERNYKRVTSY
ncbi:hypothetical protein N431DRAFT_518338 [Stipitochalara longipes BDJ]|nr:hypothetical protein N431DRAFT_518338 [Stipitochalara longipes BDJ]